MATEQCPYCFRQVLPRKDRRCPACSESIDQEPNDERAGSELVWLSNTTKLPAVCVQCGAKTEDVVSLQAFSTSRAHAFFGNLFRLPCRPALALIGLFSPELAVDDGYRMLRKIPYCSSCKITNRPRMHATDHHTYRIGILVRSEVAHQIQHQGEQVGGCDGERLRS